MKALRESTPQARHHFTQIKQVDQLLRAVQADPDRVFMARLMMLFSTLAFGVAPTAGGDEAGLEGDGRARAERVRPERDHARAIDKIINT